MLIDLLLKLASSLMVFLLGFFPAIPLPFSASDFVAAWAVVRPIAGLADYWAPVHEALGVVAIAFTVRVGLIAWAAINWFYKRIPVIGH